MEVYNVRITGFANGTYEFKHYAVPVNADIYEYMETDSGKDSMLSFPPKKRRRAEPEKEYNPFSEEYERMRTFEELERSVNNSLNRTRNEIFKWSRQAVWEYFITLTFDGAKTDRNDYGACLKRTRKWFEHQKERHAPDLKYLYVPEEHKKGGWHIHGLLADTGDMAFTDSGRVSVGGKACLRNSRNCMCPVIYNLSGWKYGFSTATAVTDPHRVSVYILKYITKELVTDTPYRHRYFRSRNLPEPEEHTYLLDMTEPDAMEKFTRQFEDSAGAELVYEKSVTGMYTSVDYKYYRIPVNEGRGDEQHGKKRT